MDYVNTGIPTYLLYTEEEIDALESKYNVKRFATSSAAANWKITTGFRITPRNRPDYPHTVEITTSLTVESNLYAMNVSAIPADMVTEMVALAMAHQGLTQILLLDTATGVSRVVIHNPLHIQSRSVRASGKASRLIKAGVGVAVIGLVGYGIKKMID